MNVGMPHLLDPADTNAAAQGLARLCGYIGVPADELAPFFAEGAFAADLYRLETWLARLESVPRVADLTGPFQAFHAAEILATFGRPDPFSEDTKYPSQFSAAMKAGAEAHYQYGRQQFGMLQARVKYVAEWVITRSRYQSLIAIESPLGNSLPLDVMDRAFLSAGLRIERAHLLAPRNTRRTKGRVIEDAVDAIVAQCEGHDLVLYLDDVRTGTRFNKLFDVLRVAISPERLIAFAMDFPSRTGLSAQHEKIRHGLAVKLDKQPLVGGPSDLLTWFRFPPIPRLYLDRQGMVWENSSLAAGKRKVNLVFGMIDHFHDLVENPESGERVTAWLREGAATYDRGSLARSLEDLRNLRGRIDWTELTKRARIKFPEDYVGATLPGAWNDVARRYHFIASTLIEVASGVLGEQEALNSWRALEEIVSLGMVVNSPEPETGYAYSAPTASYNSSLRTFNRRLVELIWPETLK